jgi:hypothetical protein
MGSERWGGPVRAKLSFVNAVGFLSVTLLAALAFVATAQG